MLSRAEQKILIRARAKIERMRHDLLHSKGLTREEARVAAKAGLIDLDQSYWWTEGWQKGERAAERDARVGKVEIFSVKTQRSSRGKAKSKPARKALDLATFGKQVMRGYDRAAGRLKRFALVRQKEICSCFVRLF